MVSFTCYFGHFIHVHFVYNVLERLKLVNFTTVDGKSVSFDANGDTLAQYDLLNWQYQEDGSVIAITIGQYDSSLPEGQRFRFTPNARIAWTLNSTEPPKSVCRDPCPAGSRKAINKHAPVCCFDCVECPEGSISNETDSSDCFACPDEFWPNEKKDKCIPKPIEFLSFREILGTLLTLVCCFGVFLSILIFVIFLLHKETPIVRANNSELSFLLLFSLKLCFLCSLTFIDRPSDWSCMLRHTAFGITFVLCISCVLGKTLVVLMAFRATIPSSNVKKWFGPTQQRLSVLAFTLIQVVICVLWLTINPPFPNRNGDVMIGGIFPILNKQVSSTSTFERKPPHVKCAGFDLRAFRWTQVMIFAIEEINNSPTLLPDISLGYNILNSCASPTNTLRAALTLVSRTKENESNSTCRPPVTALIAESGSSQSLILAGTFGPFKVPIVSYFSTCACLSNRAKYPTFFRTIPSDFYQAKALAALVKRFGWRWIGAIQSDNDYGRNGILAFREEVEKMGVCVAFVGTVLRTYKRDKILAVIDMIKRSTVKVILAFVPEGDLHPLMTEIVKQNITGIQWIASEAWITAARPSTPEMYHSFGGSIGFVVRKMSIPKLRPFLIDLSPYTGRGSAFVNDFWEVVVGCKPPSAGTLSRNLTQTSKICNGNESLRVSQNAFFNVTQLRVSYNVYKAVYAVAHALHFVLFCQPVGNKKVKPCLDVSQIQPKEVSHHLQDVHFTDRFGDTVFFDQNGDPPASYDIINWQMRGGQVQHVTVGNFTSAAHHAYELRIQEEQIVWRTGKRVAMILNIIFF
ncbi:Extracellular calcium-sensing receptor [Merluccius polli]|uniref:Extracellular calcium-sensing receptor n=1 Tax=Merluccius polli TaxID=89951 RepID=A0AA47MJF3_MERPO|nr:Extracellular calcium-sensing receptor [Merluccius polli]